MPLTFLEMAQRVHSESLRSTSAPTTVVGATDRNTRIFNRIADAWRTLQTERDWRWMRTTLDVPLTANLQTYTPADLGLVAADRFGRWRKNADDYCPKVYVAGSLNTLWDLDYWELDAFRDNWVYIDQGASTPIAWTFDENDQLLLGPKPALAYMIRIEFWKSPSDLVDDADTPDLPDRFKLLPVWEALQRIAVDDGKPEVLERARQESRLLRDQLLADQARLLRA